MANRPGKIRMTLDLPESVHQRVEEIRRLTGADNLTDVVKRALALYDFVMGETILHNKELVVRDAQGNTEKIRVIQ